MYGVWRAGRGGGGVGVQDGRRVLGIGVVDEGEESEEGRRKGRAPEGEAWLLEGWVWKATLHMCRYVCFFFRPVLVLRV